MKLRLVLWNFKSAEQQILQWMIQQIIFGNFHTQPERKTTFFFFFFILQHRHHHQIELIYMFSSLPSGFFSGSRQDFTAPVHLLPWQFAGVWPFSPFANRAWCRKAIWYDGKGWTRSNVYLLHLCLFSPFDRFINLIINTLIKELCIWPKYYIQIKYICNKN